VKLILYIFMQERRTRNLRLPPGISLSTFVWLLTFDNFTYNLH